MRNKNLNTKRLVTLLAVLVVCMLGLATVAYAYNATYQETIDPQDISVTSENSYIQITSSDGLSNPEVVTVQVTAEYGETETTNTTAGQTINYKLTSSYTKFFDESNSEISKDLHYADGILSIKLGTITITKANASVEKATLKVNDLEENAGNGVSIFNGDLKTTDFIFESNSVSSGQVTFSRNTNDEVTVDVWVQKEINNQFLPADTNSTNSMAKSGTAYLPGLSSLSIEVSNVYLDGNNFTATAGSQVTVLTTASNSDNNAVPVSVTFSKIPENATKLTAMYSTDTTANQATLELTLAGSNGTNIFTEADQSTATVTVTLPGEYSRIVYSGSDVSQPTDPVFKYTYGFDGKVTSTTITFTTTHFSNFVACKDSISVSDAGLLKAALNSNIPSISLSNDVTLESETKLDGAHITLDLNGKTLTLQNKFYLGTFSITNTNTDSSGNPSGLILKDSNSSKGKLQVSGNNLTPTTGVFRIGKDSSVTVDGVTINADTGTLFFPNGSAASLTIENSTITAKGSYVVSTNASKNDNGGVSIILDNTTITHNADGCAVMINTPNSSLTITKSNVTSQGQALAVRAGTAEVSNSTLSSSLVNYSSYNSYINKTWASGNEFPMYPVVVGDTSSNAYNDNASLTLSNVTILNTSTANSGKYIYMADDGNYSTTLTLNGTMQYGSASGNIASSISIGPINTSTTTDTKTDYGIQINSGSSKTKIAGEGVFSNEPAYSYLAKGYVAVKSNDVYKMTNKVYVSQDGDGDGLSASSPMKFTDVLTPYAWGTKNGEKNPTSIGYYYTAPGKTTSEWLAAPKAYPANVYVVGEIINNESLSKLNYTDIYFSKIKLTSSIKIVGYSTASISGYGFVLTDSDTDDTVEFVDIALTDKSDKNTAGVLIETQNIFNSDLVLKNVALTKTERTSANGVLLFQTNYTVDTEDETIYSSRDNPGSVTISGCTISYTGELNDTINAIEVDDAALLKVDGTTFNGFNRGLQATYIRDLEIGTTAHNTWNMVNFSKDDGKIVNLGGGYTVIPEKWDIVNIYDTNSNVTWSGKLESGNYDYYVVLHAAIDKNQNNKADFTTFYTAMDAIALGKSNDDRCDVTITNTMTVANGATLTINGYSSVTIDNGATLVNNGTISPSDSYKLWSYSFENDTAGQAFTSTTGSITGYKKITAVSSTSSS